MKKGVVTIKTKKDKNKRMIKRIAKQITRLDKLATKMYSCIQKLQVVKASIEQADKAA